MDIEFQRDGQDWFGEDLVVGQGCGFGSGAGAAGGSDGEVEADGGDSDPATGEDAGSEDISAVVGGAVDIGVEEVEGSGFCSPCGKVEGGGFTGEEGDGAEGFGSECVRGCAGVESGAGDGDSEFASLELELAVGARAGESMLRSERSIWSLASEPPGKLMSPAGPAYQRRGSKEMVQVEVGSRDQGSSATDSACWASAGVDRARARMAWRIMRGSGCLVELRG